MGVGGRFVGNHLTQTELSTEKEQQEYVQYLQAAIVDQVAAQINVPASLVKRFLTTAQQNSPHWQDS